MWEFVHQIQELITFYHQSWEPLRSNSQIWKLEQSMSQQRTVESQAVDWVLQFGRDSHRLESWPVVQEKNPLELTWTPRSVRDLC